VVAGCTVEPLYHMTWISEALERRFPNNTVAPPHFEKLLSEYEGSDLAPPNMQQEVRAGERGLRAHIWEAMLFRYFKELGFGFLSNRVLKAGQQGPDFGLVHGDSTIWVEAIVPAPEGIPAECLEPPKRGVVTSRLVPHREILLTLDCCAEREAREIPAIS
jgi:hypothetical protein